MYKSAVIDSLRNQNSTGYSSYGRNSLPFQKKSVSQIKMENLLSRESNRNYIESMYKSGKFFSYDLRKPHLGTHKFHLGSLEDRTRSMLPDIDFEKNRIMIFRTQCNNLREELKNDYKKLRVEMQDEVDALQLKFGKLINEQKIQNIKVINKINDAKSDLVDTNNLITELKQRINSLKLRIDGIPMFNSDGIPVLNTKID